MYDNVVNNETNDEFQMSPEELSDLETRMEAGRQAEQAKQEYFKQTLVLLLI